MRARVRVRVRNLKHESRRTGFLEAGQLQSKVGVIGTALKSDVLERGAYDRHISAQTSKGVSDQGTPNRQESVSVGKRRRLTYFWK